MRIVSLINERDVIERILRHLGLWGQGVWSCRQGHRRYLLNGSSNPAAMTHFRTTIPSRS
jgi:hypothetical protein